MSRQRVVHFEWSIVYTMMIFLLGVVVWLLTNYQVIIMGEHLHHWYLGIWAFIVAFIQLFLSYVGIQLTIKTGGMARPQTVHLGFYYKIIPLVSTLVYLVIGVFCIITDWPDFIMAMR